MPQSKKKINTKKSSLRSFLLKFGLCVLLLGVVVTAVNIYLRQEREMERLRAEEEVLNLQLEDVQREAAQIQELNALVGSTDYIERIARQNLGLVRPDEIIFIQR